MPILFISFILFVIWLNVKLKRTKKISTWDADFWAKEHDSNFARKKDISQLEYISIPEESLPFSDTAVGEEAARQEEVRQLLSRRILNLSGMSNADIKLAYGVANFTELSACDQNYLLLIRSLGLWGSYLHRQCSGQDARARQILELAVQLGSDISDTFQCLAEIYQTAGQSEKLQALIDIVEQSDFPLKSSILKSLHELCESASQENAD